MARPRELSVGGRTVPPGVLERFEIPLARLPPASVLSLPVAVVHGRRPGPFVFLTAALHGDELNGIEIVRQVLDGLDPATMRGAVVAAPVVNVFGFSAESRYLPDRRDLNRSFPGSPRGSMAARLAHIVMAEIVAPCDFGIDLHTGSDHRENLPHVRADLDDRKTREAAAVFGAPVALHAPPQERTLRAAAAARGIPALVFEGGEALRLEKAAVRAGRDGIRRVLSWLGVTPGPAPPAATAPQFVRASRWVRAPRSGLLHIATRLGEEVEAHQKLGTVVDVFGDTVGRLRAPSGGTVIGLARNPHVHQGDAVVHLALAGGGSVTQ